MSRLKRFTTQHSILLLLHVLFSILLFHTSHADTPLFSDSSYLGSVSEDATSGVNIVQVTAIEPNSLPVTYSMDGVGELNFDIGSSTGIITLQGSLDRETQDTYDFNVFATDDPLAGSTSTVSVKVVVNDVNDEEPQFVNFVSSIAVPEDTTISSFIILITASDADLGNNGAILFSLTGPNSNTFAIDSISGEITLAMTLDYEAETQFNILIVLTDQGSPALTNQRGLQILVTDVHDHPPEFQDLPYTASVSEAASMGDVIFTVTAIDVDIGLNNTVQYTRVTGTNEFAVDLTSGQISVNDPSLIDFESATTQYLLVVLASEVVTPLAGQTATATITITVTDANDNAPIFSPTAFTAEIAESAETGHFVLQLTITDIDTVVGTYTYAVTDAVTKFAVDSSGVVSIASTLDYETLRSETINVEVCDTAAIITNKCSQGTVTVTVTDVNDNSPTFNQPSFTSSVIFEESANQAVITITADDLDDTTNKMVSYFITGTGSTQFTVDSAGSVTNNVALDRETLECYDLVYNAKDLNPDHSRTSSVPLEVCLLDINDKTPQFVSVPSPCTFDVFEEMTATDLMTFQILDEDKAGTINSEVDFATNDALFAVRTPATGNDFVFHTTGALNREGLATHTVQITVTDRGTNPGALSSTTSCTINVLDINDNDPVITPLTSVTFIESSPLGTSISTIAASDDDINENGRVTYEIDSGNLLGVFSIDTVSGQITLVNSLDYEVTISYTLTLSATDHGEVQRTALTTLLVTISDSNDNPPVFSSPRYEFMVTELSMAGVAVGAVITSDADRDAPNNVVSVAILTGSSFFTINDHTIEVATSNAIFWDLNPEFTLTLQATDGGTVPGPLTSDIIDFVITVSDTNNNSPVFVGTSPFAFSLSESSSIGTTVGVLSATDIDEAQVLTFGGGSTVFLIDPSTGAITTLTSIDRETIPSYSVTFTVQDQGALNTGATAVITVLDFNDVTPAFAQASGYAFTVAENTVLTSSVGTIGATDGDSDANNINIDYSLDDLTYFSIDSTTGVITTSGTVINFEDTPVIVLTATATDNGAPPLRSNVQVTMTITNLNDIPPVITNLPTSIFISEVTGTGISIFVVSITDDDNLGGITIDITSGNTNSDFVSIVTGNTAEIQVQNPLNRETTPSYTLTIQVSDTAATDSQTLAVTLTDVNDNDPIITACPASFSLPEDTLLGVKANVVATDDDEGVNQELYYVITSGVPDGRFLMDADTGALNLVIELEYDNAVQSYPIVVTVHDGGLVERSAVCMFTITVTDVNDNFPLFTSETYRISISETQIVPFMFPILLINTLATDLDDLADNGKVVHSITNTGDTDLTSKFQIEATTGVITMDTLLNFEIRQEFLISIQAVDSPVSGTAKTATALVIVTVLDENDNDPLFLLGAGFDITINEETTIPAVIGSLLARDLDSTSNGEIVYSLSSHPSQVSIDSDTGELELNSAFDRESLSANPVVFQVTATDQGTPSSRATTVDVRLTIQDVNDNPPVFSLLIYTFTPMEDLATSGAVGTVLATETMADEGTHAEIRYGITHGGEGHFAIDIMSGDITTLLALNREVEDIFELTVVAHDASALPLSSYAQVLITILDVNDNPPIFEFTNYHCNATEEVTNDVISCGVPIKASDIDINVNDDITYSVMGITEFKIDNPTDPVAVISTAMNLDSDITPQYVVTLYAIDGGASPMTGSTTLHITLIDTNDKTPQFNNTMHTATLPEDTPGGTSILTVTASDADIGINSEIEYRIQVGFVEFRISADSGELFTTEIPFDFEDPTKRVYILTIIAVDKGTPPKTGTATATITITDVNDNPPVFTSQLYTGSIAEEMTSSTPVAIVATTDADLQTPAFMTSAFSIRTGNESGQFFINSATGEITVIAPLDRDVPALPSQTPGTVFYTLVIQAVDESKPTLAATTHVEITVTDINDNSPVFQRDCPAAITVVEQQTGVIGIFTATDEDFGTSGQITLSISVTQSTDFSINSLGEVNIVGIMNRENIGSYTITVTASDQDTSSPLSTICVISVTIQDINDNDPIFTIPTLTMDIDEGVTSFTPALFYTATDEDISSNADIFYLIVFGNTGNAFRIEQNTGEVTIAGTLDYEAITSYALDVNGTDGGTPPRSGAGKIIFTILDVNDNTPILVDKGGVSIAENIANTTMIYQASSNDADDTSPNNITEYTLINTDPAPSPFTLSLSGSLSIANANLINRESIDSYVVTIQVIDKGTPPRSSTLNVTITVTDFNDNNPLFDPNTVQNFSLPEDTIENDYTGNIIYLFNATDEDIGTNGEFTFGFTSGNLGTSFAISSDGILTRAKYIDRETYDDFTIVLFVRDLAISSLSSEITILLDITDVNDNTPMFNNTNYQFTAVENSANDTYVGTILASDIDEGNNKLISYTLIGDVPFSVHPDMGTITVLGSLDRETTPTYVISIEATDMGVVTNTGTSMITIQLLDVNDNQPTFTQSIYNLTLPEHFSLNTVFDSVSSVDLDLPINSVTYYYILTNNETFAVKHGNGMLSLNADLDYEETIKVHACTLLVSNTPTLPDPSSYNYEQSMASVLVTLTDVNDNPPIFTRTWYTVGVSNDVVLDTEVFQLSATDRDEINTTSSFGLIKFRDIRAGTAEERVEFEIQESGLIITKVNLEANVAVGDHVNYTLIAYDNNENVPTLSDTSMISIWVLTDDMRAILTINVKKTTVVQIIDFIIDVIQNITGGIVNIDSININFDNDFTDITFHVIDRESLAIIDRDRVIKLVDENKGSINDLFGTTDVTSINPASVQQIKLDPVLLAIIGILGFFLIYCCILLVCCLVYDQIRRKQIKKYHRMSLLKSYDASMTSDFDYSQMQTYENPMWLHPYEQWDEGSQESNPLFYESQEFVMDMFKENISDRSDSLSYQSWKQTNTRAQRGRAAASESSTITRMSEVNQDYNVELLAEVLGDDLPPSTEGSEITSI